MIFSQHFETKWHDTDAERFVRPSAILMYMEETSGNHMRHVGRSLDDIRDRDGVAFILSRIGINFYAPVSPFRDIRIDTWVNDSRGYSSVRHFRMFDGDSMVAEASTVWALIDLEKKFPVKIQNFDFGFDFEEEIIENIPSRIRIPKDVSMLDVGTRKIVYSDIDYNQHMNNTHYPDMLCDYVPTMQAKRVGSMMLSFLREAAYGHTLRISRGTVGKDDFLFRTENEKGETCLEAQVTLAEL